MLRMEKSYLSLLDPVLVLMRPPMCNTVINNPCQDTGGMQACMSMTGLTVQSLRVQLLARGSLTSLT